MGALDAHSRGVNSVSFSADGKLLATASRDRTIRIWNMTTRKLLDILEGHDSGVWSAIFAPDSRTLISGDWSGKIRCWQLSR